MSQYQQPDVGVFQIAGTDMYSYFNGTGSNSQFTFTWDYSGNYSTGDHDFLYVRAPGATGTDPWEYVTSRWNDQSHILRVSTATYGTAVMWGLQNRNVPGVGVTNIAATTLLVRYPFITSLAVSVVDPLNIQIDWTTNDSPPPGLQNFHLYSDSGGLPFHRVGTFDADERGSSMGNPAGFSVADHFYMVAIFDPVQKHSTFPSDTVAVV